jgi:hypothetical protein
MQKLLIISTALAALSLPTLTLANDCGQWQSKLKSTQRKLNNGGNQSQVRQWAKERDYYAETLDRCNKKAGTHRWIETANNPSTSRHTPTRGKREKPRALNTENPQLQQIIATCNYWIDQYNTNASDTNYTYQTTACRHADQMMAEADSPPTKHNTFAPTRSLKECVKPDNRIDEDVKRCMQGQMEPQWRVNR